MRRLRVFFIAVLPLAGFAQTAKLPERQIESETAKRIEALDEKFKALMELTDSEKLWMAACGHMGCDTAAPGVRERAERARLERDGAMNAVASEIQRQVDAYIHRAVRPDRVDPAAVGQSVSRILGKIAWGPTSVFVTSIGDTPSLVVGYTISKGGRMGRGGTSVTVRVYIVAEGSFGFVSAGGGDMDGYTIRSFLQLHSPIRGELWVLLSGYMTGANGPNNQMRVYAFDGTRFRLVWGPDDNWGTFTVRVTDNGFTVEGDYYTGASANSRPARRDVYFLGADGVHRVPR